MDTTNIVVNYAISHVTEGIKAMVPTFENTQQSNQEIVQQFESTYPSDSNNNNKQYIFEVQYKGTNMSNGKTFFQFEYQSQNTSLKKLSKRYSQFYEIVQLMFERLFGLIIPGIPPKNLTQDYITLKNDPTFMEIRTVILTQFMKKMLNNRTKLADFLPFQDFLKGDDFGENVQSGIVNSAYQMVLSGIDKIGRIRIGDKDVKIYPRTQNPDDNRFDDIKQFLKSNINQIQNMEQSVQSAIKMNEMQLNIFQNIEKYQNIPLQDNLVSKHIDLISSHNCDLRKKILYVLKSFIYDIQSAIRTIDKRGEYLEEIHLYEESIKQRSQMKEIERKEFEQKILLNKTQLTKFNDQFEPDLKEFQQFLKLGIQEVSQEYDILVKEFMQSKFDLKK